MPQQPAQAIAGKSGICENGVHLTGLMDSIEKNGRQTPKERKSRKTLESDVGKIKASLSLEK